MAALAGSGELVAALIACGANPNSSSDLGTTALHNAVRTIGRRFYFTRTACVLHQCLSLTKSNPSVCSTIDSRGCTALLIQADPTPAGGRFAVAVAVTVMSVSLISVPLTISWAEPAGFARTSGSLSVIVNGWRRRRYHGPQLLRPVISRITKRPYPSGAGFACGRSGRRYQN